jgi:hypothetical protein
VEEEDDREYDRRDTETEPEKDRWPTPIRGILVGLLVSTALWAVIVLAVDIMR